MRMIVIGSLARRNESQLRELHRVEAIRIRLGNLAGESLTGSRRQQHLVSVEMDEPVRIEFGCELLLALKDLPPAVRAVSRDAFNAAQARSEITARDGDGG